MANSKLNRSALISLAVAKLITLTVFFAVASTSGFYDKMIQVMGKGFFGAYLFLEIAPILAMAYEFVNQDKDYTFAALMAQASLSFILIFFMGIATSGDEAIAEIPYSVLAIVFFVPQINFVGQLILAVAMYFPYRSCKKIMGNSSEESLLI